MGDHFYVEICRKNNYKNCHYKDELLAEETLVKTLKVKPNFLVFLIIYYVYNPLTS